MYIIFGALILILVFFFWDSIISMLNIMKKGNIESGYTWFFSLLIINIVILSFIIGFYYYKNKLEGKIGKTGEKGFPGEIGSDSFLEIPCYNTK